MKRFFLNGYVLGVLASTGILLILLWFRAVFERSPPLLLFQIAIVLAAWSGGLRAGLFTTVLNTAISVYFLVEPYHAPSVAEPSERLRLELLMGVGGVLSLVVALLRESEQRALREALRQKEWLEMEITERRQAEWARETAHAEAVTEKNRLKALMDALPVGVAIVDAQGGITQINRAYEQVWGGSFTAGRPIHDYDARQAWWVDTGRPVQPEEWASAQAILKEEAVVGQVLEIERLDGSRAFVHNSAVPIRDARDAIVGSAVTVMDITEQVRNERALRESEERLQLALEINRSGTWDWNLETGEIVWSRGHYEILGYGLDEVKPSAQALADRLAPEDWLGIREAIRTSMANHRPYAAEFRVVWPDGSVHWMSGRGRYEYNQNGRCRRMIGIMVDITERKIAEEALKAADRRKNEFLAMLSHELRNPLAPIRNAVQLMRKLDVPDPKLAWARDVIERQMGHLVRLVDDLLDVSRIIQGKLTLQKAPVEIVAIISQAVETCQPFLDQRRHVLTVTLPRMPMRLEGDGVRLAQVIANLLNNAAKYTPDGGRIELTAALENGEAVISVRDNGEGIPAHLLPYVFDLFTQAERTLDRSQGGMGLGLTIVRSIVAMHGGKVEAHSKGPGKGSEFVVRLPVLETGTAAVQDAGMIR
jgi:PAS domain S-box-containing protein